ncbi:MAG: Rne/Rng family ribonuclease [Bilophila sp.]
MTDSDRIEPLAGTAPVVNKADNADLSAPNSDAPRGSRPADSVEPTAKTGKPVGRPAKTPKPAKPAPDPLAAAGVLVEAEGEESPYPRRRGRGRPKKTETDAATDTVHADKPAAKAASPKTPKTPSSRTKAAPAVTPVTPLVTPTTATPAGVFAEAVRRLIEPFPTTPAAPIAPAAHVAPRPQVSAPVKAAVAPPKVAEPISAERSTPPPRTSAPAAPTPPAQTQPALTAHPVQAPVIATPVLPVSAPPAAVPATTSYAGFRPVIISHGGRSAYSARDVSEPAVADSRRAGVSSPASAPVTPVAPAFTASGEAQPVAEGEAAPIKRRRSRRSGRGRKRPVEGVSDGELMVTPAPSAPSAVASVQAPSEGMEEASLLSGTVSSEAVAPDALEKPKSRSRRRRPAKPNLAAEASANAAIALPAAEQSVVPRDEESAVDADFEAYDADEEASQNKRSRGRGRKKNTPKPPIEIDDEDDVFTFDDDDDDLDDDAAAKAGRIKKVAPGEVRKMLVSVLPGDQVEVVLAEGNKVCEYYVEMTHQAKIRGNIYKGVINNIDANLQAAFVNYGNVKNGFLQIDEVHPEYYLQPHEPMKGRKYPPMQKVLKAGQEVLVQVVKEPTGNKGAFLTTWVSLAGRFLVLTPGQEQIGISRKVEDGEERNRLRELIKGLEPGEGLGAIVRTVSAGTSKTTLQKDLSFLKRVWKDIRKRATTEPSPSLIYQEPGLASRSVRDYLSDDVTEVWVDDAETAESIREMAGLLFPRKADLVHLYEDHHKTLWEQFGVQKQIEQVQAREVTMPSGGRLVFDQTEALMAIDINSGRIGGKTNFESMAHRTNMEAAVAIAQQLRLRDIGGQIVIDFIEMRDPEHGREVEKALRNAMKGDRARHDIGKMSSFGLLQIVRQRTGSSAISISMEPCPHCKGTGQRRNLEWQAVQALRDLHRAMRTAASSGQTECLYTVDAELGLYLLNHKRERLVALEKDCNIRLDIRINGVSPATAVTL